jgi:hypothetical protein
VRRDSLPPGLLLIAGGFITARQSAEFPPWGGGGRRAPGMKSIALKSLKKNEGMAEVRDSNPVGRAVTHRAPAWAAIAAAWFRTKSGCPGSRMRQTGVRSSMQLSAS